MPKTHTDREYESQLQELTHEMLLMAGRVEEMIESSIRAVVDGDVELAQRTIAADAKVNRAELEIDEQCMQVLARRQPMASDLRFITLALKMVTDLERIGDLAVNISERAIDLQGTKPLVPYDDIERMAELVRSLVRDAIDAFVNKDVARARTVIERDDQVDELYIVTFRSTLAAMVRDPSGIERGIHLQSVAKWLERMADHSTNIAEQVIFMIQGKDVRHRGKLGQ